MSPGARRPLQARTRPCPGRPASRRSTTADDGELKPVELPNGAEGRRQSARAGPCSRPPSPTRSPRSSSTVVTQGTGDRRADPGHVRRGQDGHHGELRRRVVRRLDGRDHRRGLGRLPGRAAPDGDGVPRPARSRAAPTRRTSGAPSSRARTHVRGVRPKDDEEDEDPTLPGTTAPATPAVPEESATTTPAVPDDERADRRRRRRRARAAARARRRPRPEARRDRARRPPRRPRRPREQPAARATAAAPSRRPASSEPGRPRARDGARAARRRSATAARAPS